MINRETIDNLCTLARLGATDQEKEQLTQDLGGILDYVDQIKAIDVPDDIAPIYAVTNIRRPDDHAHAPRSFTETLLAQAPQRQDDYVQVQTVLKK